MSANEIDGYLDTLEEPKRATLSHLRDTIMAIVPDAEECISYGMPAFKVRGKTIAGFAAFKNHLSYLPHSGSVISKLVEETEGYTSTRESLQHSASGRRPSPDDRHHLSDRIPKFLVAHDLQGCITGFDPAGPDSPCDVATEDHPGLW